MKLVQPLTSVLHLPTFAVTFSSPVPEGGWLSFADVSFSMRAAEQIVEPGALGDDDANDLRRFDRDGKNLVYRECGRGGM